MGRPQEPSTNTIRKLFERLQKGPLHLADWRSTSLGSRNTVYCGLRFLEEKELATRHRDGHKFVYTLVKDENVTPEMIDAGLSPIRISTWLPYLVTERDWKSTSRIDRETKTWAKNVIALAEQSVENLIFYVRRSEDQTNIEKINVSVKEILSRITNTFHDWDFGKILEALENVIFRTVCWECLNERGIISPVVLDSEVGEHACQSCGIVIYREQIITSRD